MEIAGVVLLIIVLLLMTQRWFWISVFALLALAAYFAMVASVIHFQILGALGFFVLMNVCGEIGLAIAVWEAIV